MKSLKYIFAISLAIPLLIAHSEKAVAQEVELYEYTVQKGDTCVGIATRELGARKAFKTIHKHNDLGKLPHKLRPGQILRLPRTKRSPDAKLGSAMGTVEYRKPTQPAWDPANLGQDLFRAWRVWSKESSTAVVVFQDDSAVSLRENTVIVVYGPSSKKIRKKITKAHLESGSLRTRLAALSKGRLVVETDASVVELSEGSAVVGVANNSSTISNHEGKAISVRGRKGGRSVKVGKGKGTWVEKGKAPAKPRALPVAPTLKAMPPLHLGLAATGVSLRGSWNVVPGVKNYRIEIATDLQGKEVMASLQLPAKVTSFEVHGLPTNRYYIRVSSVDDRGLESLPSPHTEVGVLALVEESPIGQKESAKTTRNLDTSEVGAAPTLSLGSVLHVPDGYTCASGDNFTSSIPLARSGEWEIRCKDSQGNQSNSMTLAVPKVALSIPEIQTNSSPLISGQETKLTIKSTPPFPPETKLRIESSMQDSEAKVIGIDDQGAHILVVSDPSASGPISLKVIQESSAGDVLLADIATEVYPPAEAPKPVAVKPSEKKAEKEDRIPLHFGAMLGFFESRLESDEDSFKQTPYLGLRAGISVTSWLDVEAESLLSHRFGDDSWIANNRLVLALRRNPTPDWVLRLRGGVALWNEIAPGEDSFADASAIVSASVERSLAAGAIRIDADYFAFSDFSKRLGLSLSYVWTLD